jgi:hypothetical protein
MFAAMVPSTTGWIEISFVYVKPIVWNRNGWQAIVIYFTVPVAILLSYHCRLLGLQESLSFCIKNRLNKMEVCCSCAGKGHFEYGADKSYSTSLSKRTCSHCEIQNHMLGEHLRIGFVPDFYACLPRSPGFDSLKGCLHISLVINFYLHR